MASHFLLVFALLNLAFAGSHATLTKEELHWISVFPHTPMPKFLQDILPRPGQSTLFRGDIGADGKGVNDPEFGAYSNADNSKDEDSPINKGINDPEFGAYWYDYGYKASKKKSTVDNNAPNKKSGESNDEDYPINKGINDPVFGAYWYDYGYKASKKESAANDNSPKKKGNRRYLGENSSDRHGNAGINQTIFFFPNDLLPDTKVNLPRLVQKRDMATFLPDQVAESMIMTMDKFPEILSNFSIKAESRAAGDLKITVLNCERAEMKGEKKYCGTSLESFVDLSVSLLGKNIHLLSNELEKETKNPLFTIHKGVQNLGGSSIVCHKMRYPYAVFLCHSIEKTDVYRVPLVGIDHGTKAKAMVACHKDTSAWSPNHSAFRILNAKPGDGPICHFLERDTLVWIPN
ncbi:hypothetical protein PTKIN_Ptkin03bG0097800 [Pterospermum kingtungense]